MDITKVSDLELAKLLSEQQEILSQSVNNVNILKTELKKRLDDSAKKEEIKQ